MCVCVCVFTYSRACLLHARIRGRSCCASEMASAAPVKILPTAPVSSSWKASSKLKSELEMRTPASLHRLLRVEYLGEEGVRGRECERTREGGREREGGRVRVGRGNVNERA